jgi:hypothetical protein
VKGILDGDFALHMQCGTLGIQLKARILTFALSTLVLILALISLTVSENGICELSNQLGGRTLNSTAWRNCKRVSPTLPKCMTSVINLQKQSYSNFSQFPEVGEERVGEKKKLKTCKKIVDNPFGTSFSGRFQHGFQAGATKNRTSKECLLQ